MLNIFSCFNVASIVIVEPPISLCFMIKKFETDEDLMNHIEKYEKSIDDVDGDNKTALMWAVEKGRMPVIRHMLTGNMNLDSKDIDGWTALHYAARRGNLEVCKLLLDRGADVTAKAGEDEFTPLHLACGNELVEMSEILIAAGADPASKDHAGRTPEQYLKVARNRDKVSTSIERVIKSGETPLAIRRRREEYASERTLSMKMEKYENEII